MNIRDVDLSGLRYNPSDKKDLQKLRDEYPDAFNIALYENTKLIPYDDEIIRYIILVYDMNSPLHTTIKDHNERKVKAMLMSGFEADNYGKFDKDVTDALIYGKDKGVAAMIVKYVYIFNNVDYSELMGMIEINSQILRDIHNAKTNSNTLKSLKDTSERIKELTNNIFGGKETKEIEEQLYEQLNMSRMSLRPELIAQRIASGETERMFTKNLYGKRRRT